MKARIGRRTLYHGIVMRSRLEAAFAQWLDSRRHSWEYEPCAYASRDGQYLPDFKIAQTFFVEVRPIDIGSTELSAILEQMHVIRATVPEADLTVMGGRWSEGGYDWSNLARCWISGPSEMCRSCTTASWRDQLETLLSSSCPTSIEERVAIARASMAIVNEEPDVMVRCEYAAEVARRLDIAEPQVLIALAARGKTEPEIAPLA